MTQLAVKTIVLTGATGFLGSKLAHRLVASRHRVLVLKRPSSRLDRLAGILSDLSLYDITEHDLSAPFRDHDHVDAVIHTATCYGRAGEGAADITGTNTAFPLRLLETAATFGAGAFFNTDTILEKSLNAYALSKSHFVDWGRLFARDRKLRFVNIRLEHMFGPGDDASKFTTHVIRNCLANVPEIRLTPGEQRRDFIYIDDVLSAYETLLERTNTQAEFYEEFDLGSGRAVPIREFVETVHSITGSSASLNFGAIPYRENEVMESKADITKLKHLGWRCQTSLSEGIEKTARYEKELHE